MKTPFLYKDKKSQVLITAIVVLALVLAVVAVMHLSSRGLLNVAILQTDMEKAYQLARSGIDIGESFRAGHPTSSLDKAYEFGEGVVKVEVNTASNTITSTATAGKSSRVLKKTFDPTRVASLVAYWKFEGDAHDETGKNNGVLYAWLDTNGDNINEAGPSDLPEFVAGVKGKAIRLRRLTNQWSCRNNNGVMVPDSPSLDIRNQITLCAWLNHEAGDSYGIYGFGKIITKCYYDGFTNPWELYSLDITSSTLARFIFTDGIASGKSGYASSTSTIAEGVWYHFAGTYDGNVARFYVNGVPVSERNISPDFLIGVNNESVFIGGVKNSPFHMYGLIDEVMIYDRALPPSEIKNIYDSQKP